MAVTVLKAPAGSGKTLAYVKRIAKAPSSTLIEIYVPTLKLAEEVKASIDSQGTSHRVAVIKGRDQPNSLGIPLCTRSGVVSQLTAKGISIFPSLCMKRSRAGTQKCLHYDSCNYIDQFQRCNVRIYTHAHLPLNRTMLDEQLPEVVIIDEDFTQHLIEITLVTDNLLNHVGSITGFQDAIAAIMQWKGTRDLGALLTAYGVQCASGKSWAWLGDALSKLLPAISPTELDLFVKRAASNHVDVRPVVVLLKHLDRVLSMGLSPSSVDVNSDGITVHHRHEITRFGDLVTNANAPNIYITDATISKEIIEKFFPLLSFHESHGKRNAVVVQCSDSICSTRSLDSTQHQSAADKQRAVHRLGDVQALVDEFANAGHKVLVVGPSKITGNPPKVPPLIHAAGSTELAHFGAVRGVDTWKNCDVLILVGRNEPRVQDVEDKARALFYDDRIPLTLSGQWQAQTVGYSMASGELIGVDVNAHVDPRVNAVLAQLREAESIQAIDRLRMIHNTQTKLVILLSKLPLPGLVVDQLLPWSELTRPGQFERLYLSNGGVLPLSAAWIANKTNLGLGAAKKAAQRLVKRGHPLLRIYMWRMSPLNAPTLAQYRLVGQRKWSKFFHGRNSLTEAHTLLEGTLGAKVVVKPL